MSDENLRELYKMHRATSEKLIYFLLAADGAAIGLAVNQTQSTAIVWSQIPLAIAVICWGLSFYFGVRHLQYVSSNLYANAYLLKIQGGQDPSIGSNSDSVAAASRGIEEAMKFNDDRGSTFASWHYRLLITGAVFYIAWHILEMYLRTVKIP